ncbi:MAG: hypothetical protein Q3999_03120 [Buchananella hordeovulneris]|nr:hypothetical protein [Buchananella hordeovulneris]
MQFDPPLVPDPDAARKLAEDELAHPIYHQSESLLRRFVMWLEELLAEVNRNGTLFNVPLWLAWIMIALLIVGLALVVYYSRRFTRATQRARASSELFQDSRPAAELRQAADRAASRGDWKTAVLERFRSIIRELDERLIIEEFPGLTAHEAASVAGTSVPQLRGPFDTAGKLFDDVIYGEVTALPDHDAYLRALEAEVLALPAQFGEAQ